MQKLFKTWLSLIFFLALFAAIIVDKSSIFFGLLLLPTIIITGAILVFGFLIK